MIAGLSLSIRVLVNAAICFGLFLLNAGFLFAATPIAEHVVIIGVDGLGGHGVRNARTPNLDELRKSGAYTLDARAVMPSSSSPNWASMIMGAPPEHHGVTSNDWMPDKFDLAPKAVGPGGIFPTIFGVVREQRPQFNIAVFHDWKDFGRLLETNAPNSSKHVKDMIETTEVAIKYWDANKPNFLFVHFDGVDHAGHAFGWKSPQYYKAVELADSLIGAILAAIEKTGLTSKTIVLVTADHGGLGKKHGGDSPDELLIPWILKGPGVQEGKELKIVVSTFDTAPTIAHAFGVKAPDCWIGKPVLEAFKQSGAPR